MKRDADLSEILLGPAVPKEELVDSTELTDEDVEHGVVMQGASSDGDRAGGKPEANREEKETKTRESKNEETKASALEVSKIHLLPSLKPSEKWNDVYTFEDALTGVWQKPTKIIGDLLLAQSALLVSAHPHSMKSLAFLQACIEAVARKTVWGRFPTPNVAKTLFIETEDPPWLVQDRIRGLAKGLGIRQDENVPGFNWICPGPFDLVKDARQLANLFGKITPDFAVISTLQNIIPGRDITEQEHMAPVNKVVIELARTFCPLVMITHSTWDKKNKRAIGSITQTANYATTLHFSKSGDHVDVALDSKVGSDEEQFQLVLETEAVRYVGDDGVEETRQEVRRLVYKPKKAPKRAKVEAAIRASGNVARTEDVAREAGVSERYARQIKKDMESPSKKTGKHERVGRSRSSVDSSGDGTAGESE